jgi:hypothetical protein
MTNPVSLGVFMTLVVSDIWVWTNNLVDDVNVNVNVNHEFNAEDVSDVVDKIVDAAITITLVVTTAQIVKSYFKA